MKKQLQKILVILRKMSPSSQPVDQIKKKRKPEKPVSSFQFRDKLPDVNDILGVWFEDKSRYYIGQVIDKNEKGLLLKHTHANNGQLFKLIDQTDDISNSDRLFYV